MSRFWKSTEVAIRTLSIICILLSIKPTPVSSLTCYNCTDCYEPTNNETCSNNETKCIIAKGNSPDGTLHILRSCNSTILNFPIFQSIGKYSWNDTMYLNVHVFTCATDNCNGESIVDFSCYECSDCFNPLMSTNCSSQKCRLATGLSSSGSFHLMRGCANVSDDVQEKGVELYQGTFNNVTYNDVWLYTCQNKLCNNRIIDPLNPRTNNSESIPGFFCYQCYDCFNPPIMPTACSSQRCRLATGLTSSGTFHIMRGCADVSDGLHENGVQFYKRTFNNVPYNDVWLYTCQNILCNNRTIDPLNPFGEHFSHDNKTGRAANEGKGQAFLIIVVLALLHFLVYSVC